MLVLMTCGKRKDHRARGPLVLEVKRKDHHLVVGYEGHDEDTTGATTGCWF